MKAVQFLPPLEGDNASYMVSGADDQCLRLWAIPHSGGSPACVQTIHEHAAPIHCIAVLDSVSDVRRTGERIFASGAADASIKIWKFGGRQIHLLQTIKASPKYFPLSLALSTLGNSEDSYILASAGTKDIVQIYIASSNAGEAAGPEFKLQANLTGHEGWIRSLHFAREKKGGAADSDLLLASASQDKYIRLWRVHEGRELPAQAAQNSDPASGAYLPGRSPSNKAYRMKPGDVDYSITFEALLFGHDDWIYSAKWHAQNDGKLQLLSTSADNSLAIWEADPSSGIWVTSARLGELSREKGATTATGSIGGFWTGLWSPSGASVVCLGRTGSWRRWDYSQEEERWLPEIAVTGHSRAVMGISWSGNGEYLLSTASDQTSRLHAEWKGGHGTWHEMSRPQIHGYDLNCIDSLGDSQFVSGADEKLMRVFSEPRGVAKLLKRLAGTGSAGGDKTEGEEDAELAGRPDGANMPVLGLSNKAIDAIDDDQEVAQPAHDDRDAVDPASAVRRSALELDRPPLEETLSRHTLWPEVEKLYGHGYEISCLAVSHDGTLVASACRASSLNHAVIRLFETARWTEVRPPLAAHSLTVARLRFSPDDRLLLSVGRDRQWAVFERGVGDEDRLTYKLLQSNPKGHARMILDAAWADGLETRVFATAGRDKQVKIWRSKSDGSDIGSFDLEGAIPQDHPVTAVDFLWRRARAGTLVLAVGTEAGKLAIYTLSSEDMKVISATVLKPE